MSHDEMKTLPVWGRLDHICVVVRDFEKVKKYIVSYLNARRLS